MDEKTTDANSPKNLTANFLTKLGDLPTGDPAAEIAPNPPPSPTDGTTRQAGAPDVAGTPAVSTGTPAPPANTPTASQTTAPAPAQPAGQAATQPATPETKPAEVKTDEDGEPWPRSAEDWKRRKAKQAERLEA